MAIRYSNNAKTTLTSAITDTDTSITVADASVFPALAAGDTMYLTLSNPENSVTEITLCTAITGNVLTVERGYEGTTALAWAIDDVASSRLTAGMLDTLLEDKVTKNLRNGHVFASNVTAVNYHKVAEWEHTQLRSNMSATFVIRNPLGFVTPLNVHSVSIVTPIVGYANISSGLNSISNNVNAVITKDVTAGTSLYELWVQVTTNPSGAEDAYVTVENLILDDGVTGFRLANPGEGVSATEPVGITNTYYKAESPYFENNTLWHSGNFDPAVKQDTLVSGTNIKTINGQDVLGSGDLVVGGGIDVYLYSELNTVRALVPSNKDVIIIEGLGLFSFYAGSTELDDGESSIRADNDSGAWLIEALSYDFVQLLIDENIATVPAPHKLLTGSVAQPITIVSTEATATTTATITGCSVGDFAIVNFEEVLSRYLTVDAYVSAEDTVTISISNRKASSEATPAGNWNILVIGE